MELGNVFGGDSLKAADLQGQEITVVIDKIDMKKFDNGNKLIITFQGKKKCLVCNKTNANRIAFAYGTNTDNWIGREITLYTDIVDFQGQMREAIRVRAKKSVAATSPQRPVGAAEASGFDDEIPF